MTSRYFDFLGNEKHNDSKKQTVLTLFEVTT